MLSPKATAEILRFAQDDAFWVFHKTVMSLGKHFQALQNALRLSERRSYADIRQDKIRPIWRGGLAFTTGDRS